MTTPFSGLLKRIFSVSDAHVGAIYSGGQRAVRIVEAGIRATDESVLKGDMFEGAMKHIRIRTRIAMVDEAIDCWAEAARGKILHVFFGNHEVPVVPGFELDGALTVAQHVREHIKQYPHIRFHEKGWLQLGDTLFTHGTREIGFIDKPPRLTRQIAELPLLVGAPGYISRNFLYPHEDVARKIFAAFEKEPGIARPVNHIVYGHTHDPFTGLTIPDLRLGGKDIQFHNTGAAIIGRPSLFQPLVLSQNAAGVTQEISRFTDLQTIRHGR
jgi:hypothetical protein